MAQHPKAVEIVTTGMLSTTGEQRQRFAEWLTQEIEEAISSRYSIESSWRKSLKLYEAVPSGKRRDFPIKNAPNLVVPLVGMATDTVYATAFDMLFSTDPIITVRATHGTKDKALGEFRHSAAQVLQRWIDYSVNRRWGLKEAASDVLLDICQLGTGAYYIPFERTTLKRRGTSVTSHSPRIHALPLEDFLFPGGSRSLRSANWVARRFYLTPSELEERAQRAKWRRVDLAEPRNATEPVREAREALGRTQKTGHQRRDLYELFEIFCQFDIDGDGIAEDLYAVFDRTSGEILKLRYTPYDSAPFTIGTYQKRAHLIHGIGVAEMISQQQIAATEVLNFWLLNMLLANCRFIVSQTGTLDEDVEMYPWKNLEVPDPSSIEFPQMADAYNSGPQAMSMLLSLAQQRTGTADLSRPSNLVGNRTSGIAALTMSQMSTRRFATAFGSMRDSTAGAGMQCVNREQERLLAGDKRLEAEMIRVLGESDAGLLIDVLRDEYLDDHVQVMMTATDPSNSKEADRQNGIILLDRMMVYYQRVLELSQ